MTFGTEEMGYCNCSIKCSIFHLLTNQPFILKAILPGQMVNKIFAIEKFAQTVAMLEVSEEQVRDKLGTMPSMVTSYRVLSFG